MNGATMSVDRPRVLVVDDDPHARRIVKLQLEADGYAVDCATGGADALAAMVDGEFDLVLLDLVMPGMSGAQTLAALRQTSAVPVMILSGLDDVANRVWGLETGADDYLVKPFAVQELSARVHAVLRRAHPSQTPALLEWDGLRIDTRSHRVWVQDEAVELTAKEFDLLVFLTHTPGCVYTRAELLHHVWNSSDEWQQGATVTEHIRRLRAKLEADPSNPRWLQTVRGVGYRFERRLPGPEPTSMSAEIAGGQDRSGAAATN